MAKVCKHDAFLISYIIFIYLCFQFTALEEKEEPEVETVTSERGAGDMEQGEMSLEGAQSPKPIQSSGDVRSEGTAPRLAEKSTLSVGDEGEEKKDEEKPVADSPTQVRNV